MSIHADPLFIQAEIDRRLELFGVGDLAHELPSRPAGDRHGRGLLRRAYDSVAGRTDAAPVRRTMAAAPAGLPRHP